ncbi:MAG: NAD(P)H-hydrate dehydratase [Nitrosospira sp.]|nr:NAD(P)H-hydrate dehydratase [Nitrosospira sp.]
MNNLTPLYSAAEIEEIQRLVAALPNPPSLMERAGLAAAKVALNRLLINGKSRVLILAGPGNNGGDAFVVARYLQAWWFNVTLVFTGKCDRLPSHAKYALEAWLNIGGSILSEIPVKKSWDAVIDGLFGINLTTDLKGKYLELVNTVNNLNLPVLSLDVPSGLNSSTGNVHGAAIHATITTTFICFKPGLITCYGPEYCGEILLCNLDINPFSLVKPHLQILDQIYAKKLLPSPRRANSHKGLFGSVGVIGGSEGMTGAALLTGTAALKLGAGRVYIGLVSNNAPRVDSAQPELMFPSAHELLKFNHLSCLVVGPGLGVEADACLMLEHAIQSPLSLVLDADALNLIASNSKLTHQLQKRMAPSILTPHPAEAAHLLNMDTKTVQNDRMAATKNLAKYFNCYVVLKGIGSICASPNGKCYINTSGNPGLGSAGTGDVLSGFISALLAQGMDAERSLLLAVYLHGAAADVLLKEHGGPIGMTASEVINSARNLLNCLAYEKKI